MSNPRDSLHDLRMFLTTEYACSYLPGRQARNLVADHWRRQELERAYLEALAAQPEPLAPSPETQLLVVETLLRIDACLAALPALTRRIFLSSQLDGLVYADIAEQEGVSLPTVKRHMSQAFLACLSAA